VAGEVLHILQGHVLIEQRSCRATGRPAAKAEFGHCLSPADQGFLSESPAETCATCGRLQVRIRESAVVQGIIEAL
jgi:hypothetical protein